MKDASEIVHYDSAGIPLYVKSDSLSEYPGMRALCHWHDDLEFIRSREGGMYYRIGSRTVLLKEGDCLIVNSRQMHYGYSRSREECRFLCILVHPRLFSANRTLYDRYIRPFIENEQAGFLYFPASADAGMEDSAEISGEISSLLEQAVRLRERQSPGYELEIIGLMHLLLGCLISRGLLCPSADPASPLSRPDPDGAAQRAWSPISSRIIQAGSPWTISLPQDMSAGANAAGSSGTVCSRLPLISSISTGSRSAGVCCWRTDSV